MRKNKEVQCQYQIMRHEEKYVQIQIYTSLHKLCNSQPVYVRVSVHVQTENY